MLGVFFFFSSRRRHTRSLCDWSSDVCSSDLLDDIGDDATIAIGRCLSYGEDVAYRPLAEIVRQLGGEDAAAGIAALLDGDEALTGPVLCLGRPEFVEMRPGWFAPGSGRSVIALEPLTHGEALELVRDAPGAPGIVRRAEGNPLFLEQLVAMGADEGALPSSIQAVLAARIERLDADERDVLERASVEGVRFHVGGSH